jgi:hypothetical protein
MSDKKDGGPAFPQHGTVSPVGDVFISDQCGGGGMSIRDWFAGQALSGFCANPAYNNADFGIVVNNAIAIAEKIIERME